jgi:DNA-binding transcriptional MerR regulator
MVQKKNVSFKLLIAPKAKSNTRLRTKQMEDNQSDRLYYSIGEVADMFAVNVSKIRYWENEFSILKPRKNKKGNRLFTKEDIKHLKIIDYLLNDQKLTLDGAKKRLAENREGVEQNAEIVTRLTYVKQKLLAIAKNLDHEPDEEINDSEE